MLAVSTTSTLNFAVVGNIRSGSSVIQSGLAQLPTVACHRDLFFDLYGTVPEQQSVRRKAHESYFGKASPRSRGWLAPGANPYRYLIDQIWDRPCRGERAVGARLLYHQLQKHELHELLCERWREGDFCVIHVVRNPIACFVSLTQAQQTGRWCQLASSRFADEAPPPVHVRVPELVDFVRLHEAALRKLRASCSDLLELSYKDLCFSYPQCLARACHFLEVPLDHQPLPELRRLRNRHMSQRIVNLTDLRSELPTDMREHLEKDLI